MTGSPVQTSSKTIDNLKGIFHDESARSLMEPTREVYSVQWWSPVAS